MEDIITFFKVRNNRFIPPGAADKRDAQEVFV